VLFKRARRASGAAKHASLGPLETNIMNLLWDCGEGNVHLVCGKLDRPLAYTTVMTTLDRLYKKGYLSRRKKERSFLYRPCLSREEWERRRAGDFLAPFFAHSAGSGKLLISCLVDVAGNADEALLDELERKIKSKREELNRKK
jgi:predicted transcriptional regulator